MSNTTWFVASALVLTVLALALLGGLVSRHCYAYSECRRAVGPDGVERDQWSFSAGHSNTFIGNTLGPIFIAIARANYERRRRHER